MASFDRCVDTFRFQFPIHFEERLVKVSFPGSMLRAFTLSSEDLAITKLVAWRRQDQEDLRGMLEAGNVDMAKLRGIVDDVSELRANFDDDDWADFERHLNEMESWTS